MQIHLVGLARPHYSSEAAEKLQQGVCERERGRERERERERERDREKDAHTDTQRASEYVCARVCEHTCACARMCVCVCVWVCMCERARAIIVELMIVSVQSVEGNSLPNHISCMLQCNH